MKINELIKTQYQRTPISQQEIDDLDKTDDFSPERGAYAIGIPTDDPHVFRKQTINPTNTKIDPTFLYIKRIAPLINTNPYFPKTYIVDLRYDTHGHIRPAYHMEALVHGSDYAKRSKTPTQGEGYSGNSLFFMAAKMFGNTNWLNATTDIPVLTIDKQDPDNKELQRNPEFTWSKLTKLTKKLFQEFPGMPTAVEYKLHIDPQLVQSFKLIKKLMNQFPQFEDDLHENNFMIRRTQIGPQLVISDPLSTRSTSDDDDYEYDDI